MDDSYQPGASAHVGKGLAHQGVPREVFFSNPGPGVTAPSDQGLFIHRACHTEVGVFTYSLSSGCAVSAFWLCPYCSTSNWGVLPVFNWVLSIFSGDVCCFSQDFCKFFFFFLTLREQGLSQERALGLFLISLNHCGFQCHMHMRDSKFFMSLESSRSISATPCLMLMTQSDL